MHDCMSNANVSYKFKISSLMHFKILFYYFFYRRKMVDKTIKGLLHYCVNSYDDIIVLYFENWQFWFFSKFWDWKQNLSVYHNYGKWNKINVINGINVNKFTFCQHNSDLVLLIFNSPSNKKKLKLRITLKFWYILVNIKYKMTHCLIFLFSGIDKLWFHEFII